MKPRFKVGDQWVNGMGQPVDEQGEVITPDTQPAPADAAAGQELLQANADLKTDLAKMTGERVSAEHTIRQLKDIISTGQQANKEQHEKIGQLTQERDAARQELETAQREGNEAQANAETLKKQVDDLVFKFSDELKAAQAAVRLPDDAKDRLVKVNGIGGKLADEAIAALTAK